MSDSVNMISEIWDEEGPCEAAEKASELIQVGKLVIDVNNLPPALTDGKCSDSIAVFKAYFKNQANGIVSV